MKLEKEIIDNAQEAFDKMTAANMPMKDKIFVMNAFRDQGVMLANECIIQDGKFFSHPDVTGFLFTTREEAIFAKALLDFAKDHSTKEKTISNLFPIILKLLGMDSEWALDLNK